MPDHHQIKAGDRVRITAPGYRYGNDVTLQAFSLVETREEPLVWCVHPDRREDIFHQHELELVWVAHYFPPGAVVARIDTPEIIAALDAADALLAPEGEGRRVPQREVPAASATIRALLGAAKGEAAS